MSETIHPEKLFIQNVAVDDLAPFRELVKALGEPDDDEYFTGLLEAQAEKRVELLLASYEGEVCAYGVLSWKPKYGLFKKLGIPEIQDLNVRPSHRRRGIAQAFIIHCENMARARGAEHMGIGVGLHSRFGPAQKLYVKMGYEPDGQGINYDRMQVTPGEIRPIDDQLCMMLVKSLVDERD